MTEYLYLPTDDETMLRLHYDAQSSAARIDGAVAMRDALRRVAVERPPSLYPHRDGEYWVLGPEVIATTDGSVVAWKGENYVPQRALVLDADAEERVARALQHWLHHWLDEDESGDLANGARAAIEALRRNE